MNNSTTRINIEAAINELFNTSFGANPQDVHVILDNRCLIIRLESFLGKIMENLTTKDDDALRSTSELIMEYLLPDFLKKLKSFSDLEFDSFYYDWDDSNLSGLIIGLIKNNNYKLYEDYYPGKEKVHFQISKITYEVEKVPDLTCSFWADENTLVIVREGLLIEIEKSLVELGSKNVLRKAKRVLEKNRIIDDANIPTILNRTPAGIYLDWMFEVDKSVLVYVFEEM